MWNADQMTIGKTHPVYNIPFYGDFLYVFFRTIMLESKTRNDASPVQNPVEDSSVDERPGTPENDRIMIVFTTSGKCSK